MTIGNHDYQFWDLSLEECTSIALQNAKFFVTTGGNSESRQNVRRSVHQQQRRPTRQHLRRRHPTIDHPVRAFDR